MNIPRYVPYAFVLLVIGLFVPLSVPLYAQNSADNTRNNKASDSVTTPTADRAKNDLSDRDLMKHIRQDVVNDKSLSTYAHNVKIIAQRGRVTLRGPVHSEEEKQTIEQYARKYAGEANVIDELSIKSANK